MSNHTWKYVGSTANARIFVDYYRHKTRIETKSAIYFHNGIYPFHDSDIIKKINKGR